MNNFDQQLLIKLNQENFVKHTEPLYEFNKFLHQRFQVDINQGIYQTPGGGGIETTKGGPDDLHDELDYYKKQNIEKEKQIIELTRKIKEGEEQRQLSHSADFSGVRSNNKNTKHTF
jgi:hypothetical protein